MTTSTTLQDIVSAVSGVLTDYVMVTVLLAAALFFTIVTRGVQFRMVGEMLRLLMRSGKRNNDKRRNDAPHHGSISSFQAFALSIASRVGTGNLAGVGTAIAIGGPGAVFWMWVIAIFGAASAFVESTLAQLFKVKGEKSFMGGPAYYILKGLHKRWWAVTFAILITLTFGFAFNSVQSNTVADALHTSFGVPTQWTAWGLCILTLTVIWGGVQRISRFSEIVVPVMAIAYIVMAIVIIILNIHRFPEVMAMIVENAFGFDEAMGGHNRRGNDHGYKARTVQQRSGRRLHTECRRDRLGKPSREARTDTDSRCLHRHSSRLHSHCIHYPLQRYLYGRA